MKTTNAPLLIDNHEDAGVGTSLNLPEVIREKARLRSNVIAWTHLDPNLEEELSRYFCCRTFGPFVACPCFWPHLLCMWPCLWGQCSGQYNAAASQYWILSENELKVLSLDHDASCCPYCFRTGDQVTTIPLENVTDCGVEARGNGIMNNCAGDLPITFVDTASSGSVGKNGVVQHEATGLALKNYDWMISEIMNRRDVIVGNRRHHHAPVAQVVEERQPASSTEERLDEIQRLWNQGILNQQEYQDKRREIISQI